MNDETNRLTILNRLLASFPSSVGGQGDDALDGYLIGTRDIPVDYLAIAAQRFLAGQVTGQHQTFAPTPAQLASEARVHWHKAIDEQRAEQARLAPPKPKEWEISDEERARVAAKFDELRAQLAHNLETEDAVRSKRNRERAEQETRWLRNRGDLVDVPGSSYPVSRTLMRQFGIGDREGTEDAAWPPHRRGETPWENGWNERKHRKDNNDGPAALQIRALRRPSA
jgi:hypothetical protein